MEAEEARREEEEADLELALDQAHSEAPVHDAPEEEGSEDGLGSDEPGPGGASDHGTVDAWAAEEPQRAQPLVIEPDALSGPVETASTGQAPEGGAGEATPAQVYEAGPTPSPANQDEPQAGMNEVFVPKTLAGQAESSFVAAEIYDEADRDSSAVDSVRVDNEDDEDTEESAEEAPPPEIVGGDTDSGEERSERRIPPRFLRNYKIQEVIRRRQILLVQVVKEERGTKGAALTTYLSLAGRFSVLMPNSPRGGGISRKITSAADRRRLKEVMTELDIPRGMGLIVRTAGANRPKAEIVRDCEYLLRLWDDIREHTLKSVAPALIYEEASLIKRAIRDVYSRDVDEILVDGEEGWRAAHDFMRMLMPAHAKKVQLWRESLPLFSRYQVESQLDAMLLPTVQLRSGGYLVINQAEALVAIDVNSGRSTRERGIEETALRTNLEAADEVARQLRLRDLAGLIVIDFIDMEHRKHNAMVERRLKEALRNDRARIQVGQISHFGLLEMSRQRLRPSLAETSFVACPHCGGTGHVRSTESAAIHVLRGIEDEGGKRRAAEIVVHVATPTALYLLNHKRERLREIELRYAMRVIIAADDSQYASQYRIERVRPQIVAEALPVVTPDTPQIAAPMPAAALAEMESDEDEDEEEDEDTDEARSEDAGAEGSRDSSGEDAERRRKRRRRRRRGRREEAPATAAAAETGETAPAEGHAGDDAGEPAGAEPDEEAEVAAESAEMAETHVEGVPEHPESGGADDDPRGRRRGRRGGRRRRREAGEGELSPVAELGAEQPEILPHYSGPTPANPFGGQAFDIFDVLEQAERSTREPRERNTGASPDTAARALDAAISNTAPPDPAMHALEPPPGEPVTETVRSEDTAETPPAAGTTPAAEAASDTTNAAGRAGTPSAAAEAPAMAEGGVAEGGAAEGETVAASTGAETPTEVAAAATGSDLARVAAETPAAADTIDQTEIANAGAPEPALTEALAAMPAPQEHASATLEVAPVEEPATAGAASETRSVPEVSLIVAPDTAMPETPPVAANDATSEPAIKPIVIGSADTPPAQKKRGWWRR
jgi:ribonuclease E